MVCLWCSADISLRRSNARFCSDAHRVTYHQAGKQPRGRVKRTRRRDTSRPHPLWTPEGYTNLSGIVPVEWSQWSLIKSGGTDRVNERKAARIGSHQ